MSTLSVEGLRVRYGTAIALDGVDLAVASGEIVTVLGPSGCGKSTMLRAIAGLVAPEHGRIAVDGSDITPVPPHRRKLGLMFQEYALFPHRDVAGNVAFGVRMSGSDRRAVDARVHEVLALVGLSGYERRSIASLSGGEQQRVALARALAPSPRLLMLDEPLGSLDRSLRERLAVELRDLFRALGTTTVTVTHDQGEAFTMADRVVLLRAGRVVQTGAPVDVWRAPADGFVARFLGFPNVFDVEVRGGAVLAPIGVVPAGRPDGPATLVIRPDGLRLVREAEAVLRGRSGPPSFRGDHFLVPVDLGEGGMLEVVARSADVPPEGSGVGVAVDHAAVLVVDR